MNSGSETSKPELLHLIVVVLPVKNVPLLRTFDNNLPLRSDLLPRRCIDLRLFGQQLFQGLARLLPDRIAILQKVHLRYLRQSIRNRMSELIQLVARNSHSTALYLRASSFFTFLNISG